MVKNYRAWGWCLLALGLGMGCARTVAAGLPSEEQWQALAGGEYRVDGESYQLSGGELRRPYASDGSSASALQVRLRREDVGMGDLNGDGRADALLLLSVDGGGSGTFYYALLLRGTEQGFEQQQQPFVGDRIKPMGMSLAAGALQLRYLTREQWQLGQGSARPQRLSLRLEGS